MQREKAVCLCQTLTLDAARLDLCRFAGIHLKIIEITNVDFSLRHFLLPLMRAMRARGHEVIGVCAEGRLLDGVRAEGFRIVAMPFARASRRWRIGAHSAPWCG